MNDLFSTQELHHLRNIKIPLRPDSLRRIKDETKQPEPDFQAIIQVIKQDLSLASAVLRVANSAAFRRSRPFTSITQAAMMLGLTRIEVIVSAVALRHSLGEAKELEPFWRQCVMVADLITVICQELDNERLQDPAYLLGLFHVSGIPVLFNNYKSYRRYLQQAQHVGWSEILGKEKINYGVTHSALSAIVASKWKLPKALVELIYHLYDEEIFQQQQVNPLKVRLFCYLKLARSLMYEQISGEAETPEWLHAELNVMHSLHLKSEEMRQLRKNVTTAYLQRLAGTSAH